MITLDSEEGRAGELMAIKYSCAHATFELWFSSKRTRDPMRAAPQFAIYLIAALFACACAPSGLAGENLPNISPAEIVRRAVHNEIATNQNAGMHFRFKDDRRMPQLSQTKLMVETNDATAGLLVLQNGRPLSPQQRHEEEARLAAYIRSPQELRKKKRQEKEDSEHTERILRALPDAFLYEPNGTELGREGLGGPGDELLRLKFRPNPNYNPPTHVEQVLTGMRGDLLIDTTQDRIAEINGTLTKEVEFGWGILGHLDPGGRFLVQQSDVGDHQWEVTHMELSFTGKVLFVKKLAIHSNDTFSDFRSVPRNLTFAQGVDLLKKEAAENPSGAAAVEAGRKTNSIAQNRTGIQVKDQVPGSICCDR